VAAASGHQRGGWLPPAATNRVGGCGIPLTSRRAPL